MRLRWGWAALAFGLILIAQALMVALGARTGSPQVVALLGMGAYFIGAMVTALLSPGRTVREPVLAATLAAALSAGVAWVRLRGRDPTPPLPALLVSIAAALAGAALLGFLGASLGERLSRARLHRPRPA